jgi:glutaredoxin-related protein
MPRPILHEAQIHPSVRAKIAAHGADIVAEVQAAVKANDIVVVGMGMNPFPRKARKLLDAAGIKLWTGWSTFPMVFVKGVLVGGANDLEKLIAKGELGKR